MEQVWTQAKIRQAMREVKAFELEGDYRPAARAAIKEVLEKKMVTFIDEHLAAMEELEVYDRRNGSYERHILTEAGDVVLAVLRTRTVSAQKVVRLFARRAPAVDRMILSCFTLGLSTRKVAFALLPALGEKVSASTVSRVAKQLDGAVQSYHHRPLQNGYRCLIFDGVVLKKKTGAGSVKRVVLVALGITHEGRKEVLDFTLAQGESQGAWEAFLTSLYKRGLTGDGVKLIVVDGGKGLLKALDLVYQEIPLQRCWAHKDRNVLGYVRTADHEAVKADLTKISNAQGLREAQKAFRSFVFKWSRKYPRAVECLRKDIDSILTFSAIPDPNLWSQVRTTNAIERRFVEVRRRTRPMGVFSDRTSMERILYAVFTYENMRQGTGTPYLLTQNR